MINGILHITILVTWPGLICVGLALGWRFSRLRQIGMGRWQRVDLACRPCGLLSSCEQDYVFSFLIAALKTNLCCNPWPAQCSPVNAEVSSSAEGSQAISANSCHLLQYIQYQQIKTTNSLNNISPEPFIVWKMFNFIWPEHCIFYRVQTGLCLYL